MIARPNAAAMWAVLVVLAMSDLLEGADGWARVWDVVLALLFVRAAIKAVWDQ